MQNPLLNFTNLPLFEQIKAENIEPAVDEVLQKNTKILEALLTQTDFSWDNLIQPLDENLDQLAKVWSCVEHINAVINQQAIREAYQRCLPKITEFHTQLGQNEQLYQAYQAIYQSEAFKKFDFAKQKVITNALRDFKLGGVSLNAEKKQTYLEINKQLSQLENQFANNVLDATDNWQKNVTNEEELAGIPELALETAKQVAQKQQKSGWVFTLDFPSYYAVVSYADNRKLREEMYTAYCTRASDQGPNADEWDNSQVMHDILACRQRLAKLLDFDHYTQLSLATKMANSSDQVLDFLNDLAERSLKTAKQQFGELKTFACEQGFSEKLQAWDTAYYSEKMQKSLYDIDQEQLRPYFPEDKVVAGLFTLVKQLYAITIEEITDFEKWHQDVRLFAIYDQKQQLIGQFYLDLYARENKRGGAWMADCRQHYLRQDGSLSLPVAFLTCNFNPPVQNKSALLTHDDVLTVFHEFGHGLHHLLTQIDYMDVAGINGVAWDAVELPSQFMENFCWEKQVIAMISAHYETGEVLPEAMYDKLYASRNFQSAMQVMRQIEFALFDFRLHMTFDEEKKDQVQALLDELRQQISVVPIAAFNRFQHGFSHIFAGGYAAGYYSYLWAEVLSSDVYARFEEQGVFNTDVGQAFLQNILQMGGSKEPMELFVAFRGREPKIDALLRHRGIS